eukprot:8001078-Lingulodinium_polyedra.AAC.1
MPGLVGVALQRNYSWPTVGIPESRMLRGTNRHVDESRGHRQTTRWRRRAGPRACCPGGCRRALGHASRGPPNHP